MEDAYVWDPLIPGIDESQTLGIEAALWTETVETWEDAEFLTYPRVLGHAEIGWSQESGRSWEEYRERLAGHGPRLEGRGVGFYASPLVDWDDG